MTSGFRIGTSVIESMRRQIDPTSREWCRILNAVGAFLLLAMMTASAVWAQKATPLPVLTGERVIVGPGVPDPESYKALESRIAELERGGAQTYYVVVVRSTGEGPYATMNYADALFNAWSDESRREGRAFDLDRSVLIVTALDNRQISVRPGRVLQERYGLSASTLDRELVQPEFIPMARLGEFSKGLARLLTEIDEWIRRRDAQQAERRRENEQRVADLRSQAEATLSEARHVLDTARTAGLPVAETLSQVEQAATSLADMPDSLNDNQVQELVRIQRSLQDAVEGMRQTIAQQAEARARLDALPARVRKLDEAIVSALEKKLPVGPARDELAAIQDQVDAARAALSARPDEALEHIQEAERRLDDARRKLDALPDQLKQLRELQKRDSDLAGRVEGLLADAEREGVDVSSIRARVKPILDQVKDATQNDVRNVPQAIASLEQARLPLWQARDQIESARARHRLVTYTIPIGVALGLIITAALIFGLVRWLRVRRFRAVHERFREFRSRAVEVMDRLDALKERYKLLPVLDKDFQAPMTGTTLDVYTRINADLNSLWDRWLAIMENVEKAQALIGDRSALGTKKLQEAEKILGGGEVFDEVEAQGQAVSSELDRLNQAHEVAGSQRDQIHEHLAALADRLKTLAAARLDPSAIEPNRMEVAGLAAQAEELRTPDPLGSQEIFRQAQCRLDSLRAKVDALLARAEEAAAAHATLEAIRAETAQHRGAGLKLDEDGGNPDHPLAEAREAYGRAWEALRAGDPETASRELALVAERTELSRQAITRTLDARELCRRELPERGRVNRQLTVQLNEAKVHLDTLAREFAPDSWKDLSGNLDRAQKLLTELDDSLNWTTAAASDSAQRYIEAARTLEQLTRRQREAAGLIEAIGKRLQELRTARDEARQSVKELIEQVRRQALWIEQNDRIVGELARTAMNDAMRRVEAANQAVEAPRPDWFAIQAALAQVRENLAIAREHAEADIKNYEQVQRELRTLRERADQVGNLLRREDKDRPPVNNRYDRAVETIDRIEAELRTTRGAWDHLLSTIRDALADLDRTEKLAHEDIQLANRAIAEIAEAHRGLRSARGYSAMGVGVDLGRAESSLHRAQVALQSQDYEQAISLANAAESAARDAYNAAVHEARVRQERLEAERRRRAAADATRHGSPFGPPGGMGGPSLPDLAGMAAVVIGNAMAEAARAGSVPPRNPVRSPSFPGSPASSTSWSSEPGRPDSPSSQSGW